MALDDGAVVLPGRGYLFWNDTAGAAPPADTQVEIAALDLTAATLPTGWRNLGHTSRENNVALGKDGTEGETKGSWQSSALRKLADETIWSLTAASLQLSNDTLDLYFGEGDISDPDVYHVLPSATPMSGALYLVLVDGSVRVPLYLAKVSATSDDAPEFDPTAFLEFSIKMTVLEHNGAAGLMSWYAAGLGTPA
ncbi:hypothetical protein GCM10022234_00140 [Aeromicrobium panaciterrae]|uniref:phage tail tube protein n=1 Tax=Aeromicrobium panaciterrae TaxID=363861 RepID=UPI0031CED3CE